MREPREAARERSTSLSQAKLPDDILTPSRLRDGVVEEIALATIEGYVLNKGVSNETLLRDLAEMPAMLAYVLSAINDATFSDIVQFVSQAFPQKAADFRDSLAALLLQRLSHAFAAVGYPKSNLRDCHRAVDIARPALILLPSLRFRAEQPDDNRKEERHVGRQRRPSQQETKRARRASQAVAIDYRPFSDLGVEVPQSQDNADRLTQDLLRDQSNILTYYMDTLRKAELKVILRNTYVPAIDPGPSSTDSAGHPRLALSNSSDALHSPTVQPLKAALYFDGAAGFGPWGIWIAQRAYKNLRSMSKKDPKTCTLVHEKLKELSFGQFSGDNQKRLTGVETIVPIFEAKVAKDTRLVYQIDCVRGFDSGVEEQVLHIFGIYTHAQIDGRFWDVVSSYRTNDRSEYRKRCLFRSGSLRSDNLILPATFAPEDSSTPISPSMTCSTTDLSREDKAELHYLLNLEHYMVFSQELIDAILYDEEVAHPFGLTADEQDIVKHMGSCFVLGRSGTGKTTTMVFKMLGREQAWERSIEGLSDTVGRPRQIFVTQSRALAEKVQEYFYKMYNSSRSVRKSKTAKANSPTAESGQDMFDLDEEESWRSGLPASFAEVEDKHFPLFLTFDGLCRLLEADIVAALPEDDRKKLPKFVYDPSSKDGDMLPGGSLEKRREHFVSYEVFLTSYWPHLPQDLTRNLDPALTFAEIIGVIKGSEATLNSNDGFLDRSGYMELSDRTQLMFATRRGLVYDLFEAYSRLKRERQDWDAADRTRNILHYFNDESLPLPSQRVDFLYVDESQDNLITDAAILRTLCRNPDGLFWAGDTAQTISAGSSFRFDELKAFVYRRELRIPAVLRAKQDPAFFQLTRNFRSHKGIMDCAHRVIQLMTEFWPCAIDELEKESGLVDGEKPLFFTGWDKDTLRYEQFLFGSTGDRIEFGAAQCILVRDDAALERLRALIGADVGITMTLYDSKGQEFDDVLLYNFFEDSTCTTSQWRVLLNAIPTGIKPPMFNEEIHNGILRELKHLYVAMTRARKNLWLADCSEKAEIFRMILDHGALVQHCTPNSRVPSLASLSSSEEWFERGNTLFTNKNFGQAMHAYARAGGTGGERTADALRREKIAEAYFLRVQADKIPETRKDRTTAYLAAAKAFHHVGEVASQSQAKSVYFRISAQCYLRASEEGLAAEAYEHGGHYTPAAKHYRQVKRFDDAVRVVQQHREVVDPSIAESIVEVAKLYYANEGELDKAKPLFESNDCLITFLGDFGYEAARSSVLEENGRYMEAAEACLKDGQLLEAVRLFLRHSHDNIGVLRAYQSVLDELWGKLPLGAGRESASGCASLLDLIEQDSPEQLHRDQLAMFHAILSEDLADVDKLPTFSRRLREQHHEAGAILCLHHFFSRRRLQPHTDGHIVLSALKDFVWYAQALQRLIRDSDGHNTATIFLLFGVRPAFDGQGDKLDVLPGSLLHAMYLNGPGTLSNEHRSRKLEKHRWDVERDSTKQMQRMLWQSVDDIVQQCKTLVFLKPCLGPLGFGRCETIPCSRSHDTPDVNVFNTRVSIHLLMIIAFNTTGETGNFWGQRSLLTLLHRALYPNHPKLGSISVLRHESIPAGALQIVAAWTAELLHAPRPHHARSPHPTVLSDTLQLCDMNAFAVSPHIPDYLRRLAYFNVWRQSPPWIIFRTNRDGRFNVLPDIFRLREMGPRALPRAVASAWHIVIHAVPIDVKDLCDLMDRLCSSLVIAQKLQRTRQLNGLIVPESWLNIGATQLQLLQGQVLSLWCLRTYFETISTLVAKLSAREGSEFLQFNSRSLEQSGMRYRSLFLLRSVHNICLFADNVGLPEVQRNIQAALQSLGRSGLNTRLHFGRFETYISAPQFEWEPLVRAVFTSLSEYPLDRLVQLQFGKSYIPPDGVQPFPYTTLAEVAKRFGTATAQNYPELPPAGDQGVQDADAERETLNDELPDAHGVNDESVETVPIPEQPPIHLIYSDEEKAAVRVIARNYKAYKAREGALTGTSMAVYRRRKLLEYLVESNKMSWTSKPALWYRVRFRGYLPSLFICASSIHDYVYMQKSVAKSQLREKSHLELEKIQERITKANATLQRTDKLLKLLAPASSMHAAKDWKVLANIAQEVQQLATELPQGHVLHWRQDLQLAMKLTLLPDALRPDPRQRRPTLNTSDV